MRSDKLTLTWMLHREVFLFDCFQAYGCEAVCCRDCESIIKNSLNRQIYKTNVWANAIRPYRINVNALETVNIANLN